MARLGNGYRAAVYLAWDTFSNHINFDLDVQKIQKLFLINQTPLRRITGALSPRQERVKKMKTYDFFLAAARGRTNF